MVNTCLTLDGFPLVIKQWGIATNGTVIWPIAFSSPYYGVAAIKYSDVGPGVPNLTAKYESSASLTFEWDSYYGGVIEHHSCNPNNIHVIAIGN